LSHHVKKIFDCYSCDRSFATIWLLKSHTTSVHATIINCEICNKRVKESSYKRHIMRHETIQNFQCDLCPRRCAHRFQMALHVNIHKKNFNCGKCGESFYNKLKYDTHILLHVDPRPFKCDMCLLEYRTKVGLSAHMTVKHISTKEFKCLTCEEVFSTPHQLRSHRKKYGPIHDRLEKRKSEFNQKSFCFKNQF
jgi:KRAB domain-containing zinc finger protein